MKTFLLATLFVMALYIANKPSDHLNACLDAGFEASHCRTWSSTQ